MSLSDLELSATTSICTAVCNQVEEGANQYAVRVRVSSSATRNRLFSSICRKLYPFRCYRKTRAFIMAQNGTMLSACDVTGCILQWWARADVTGCRLQWWARADVTGCRLQWWVRADVTGCRLQWWARADVTRCRLQWWARADVTRCRLQWWARDDVTGCRLQWWARDDVTGCRLQCWARADVLSAVVCRAGGLAYLSVRHTAPVAAPSL